MLHVPITSRRRWTTLLATLSLAGSQVACGGAVRFADRTAIVVSGPPRAPEPEPEPARVELQEDRIAINEKIQFAYDDDRILPASFGLLDEIATVIKQNPQVKKLEIGGHASTEGSDEHNLQLSDRRATAVMKYLVERAGVEETRLASKGYGELKPILDPDDTEERREVNRRVEFLILEQDTKVSPDATANARGVAPEAGSPPSEGSAP